MGKGGHSGGGGGGGGGGHHGGGHHGGGHHHHGGSLSDERMMCRLCVGSCWDLGFTLTHLGMPVHELIEYAGRTVVLDLLCAAVPPVTLAYDGGRAAVPHGQLRCFKVVSVATTLAFLVQIVMTVMTADRNGGHHAVSLALTCYVTLALVSIELAVLIVHLIIMAPGKAHRETRGCVIAWACLVLYQIAKTVIMDQLAGRLTGQISGKSGADRTPLLTGNSRYEATDLESRVLADVDAALAGALAFDDKAADLENGGLGSQDPSSFNLTLLGEIVPVGETPRSEEVATPTIEVPWHIALLCGPSKS